MNEFNYHFLVNFLNKMSEDIICVFDILLKEKK